MKRVFAEESTYGVRVWREGDSVVSLYLPETPGYARWKEKAEKQATGKKYWVAPQDKRKTA